MREQDLDHDFPVTLPTDPLYSEKYLKWQQAFAKQVRGVVSQESSLRSHLGDQAGEPSQT